jgi:LPXTG-site transpeptidase (sortase) family protein
VFTPSFLRSGKKAVAVSKKSSLRRKVTNRNKKIYTIRKPGKALAFFLIFAGLLLITFPVTFKLYNSRPRIIQDSALPVSVPPIVIASGSAQLSPIRIDQLLLGAIEPLQPPLRIVIPKYNVDLPVVEANVVNGYWETSQTTASHGVGSANPGQIGNIVIFAHARENLFGPIRNIKNDSVIYVLTKDRWHRYRVIKTDLVTEDKVEVIKPTKEEMLTLFTCSGFMDSKRLIVTATPDNP